jgi:syntaxin 5
MDRTSEFLSIAQSVPGSDRIASRTPTSYSTTAPAASNVGAGSAASASKSNPAYDELRSFHKTAADISRDIAATSALLQELTQLVRHKSLFEDDSAKINHLVVRIKSSIENLNSRLDQAGTVIAQQKRRLGKNSQAGQEASNLVDGLKTEFAEAASGFKKVLQQRTDNLKETEDLQRQVYGGGDDDPIPNMSSILSAPPPVYNSAPPSLSFGQSGGGGGGLTLDLTSGLMPAGEATSSSVLPRPHGISSGNLESGMRNRRVSGTPGGLDHNGGVPSYSGTYSTYGRQLSAPLTPLDIQRMEEESGASQLMQLIPDQDYLRERADAMSQVETNIVELGTIFNKLAVMVSEHREMVQRVEDNVDEANTNINLSLTALTDTLTSLRTNRMLALKVFSVLVAFIFLFIVFFA